MQRTLQEHGVLDLDTSQMRHVSHIGDSKEQAAAIAKIPIGKRFKKDTWENDDAYEEMIVAKTRLLKDYPFWGILSMQLVLVEDTSGYIPTLAVDGRHLFYSAEFVLRLNRGERVFGVGHEILHCLYEHTGRKHRGFFHADVDPNEKDPEKIKEAKQKMMLWNFANDYVVNDDLVLGKVGTFITTIGICHDTKFRGWSSEEIYDYLLEHPEEQPNQSQQFDMHLEIEIEEDGDGDESENKGGSESEPSKDGNTIKIKMKRSEYDKMKKDWMDNTMRAAAAQKEAEARGQCAGSLPAGVQRLLDELKKPVMNWKRMLRRYIMQTMSYDYSFNRPNKALFSDGWTLPGFRSPQEQLDLVIAVDTSGSISEEQLSEFASEMDGIMKSFPAYNILVWCFDGAVIEDSFITIKKIASEGKFEDIKKFAEHAAGGGGTNFEVNWDFMKEKKIKPKLFLFLTDGYPYGGWGDPMYCPTMFLINGNPGCKAPFGMTLHYEDAQ